MTDKQKQPQFTRVQRIVAGILTVLFIPTLVAFGLYGAVSNRENIVRSIRYSRAAAFLTNWDDPDFFEMTRARIQSLEHSLGEGILLKDELGFTNAAFQRALGKRQINAGSQQLYLFPEGQIYAMTTRESLAGPANEIVNFYNALGGEIPFLFTYVHPQFYEGGDVLPDGYSVVDTGDELAEEVLGIIREAGIPALDSREFFADSGYTQDELYLRTDMHWQTLAGILTAQIFAEEINAMTGAELDVSRIAVEQFETELYPQMFLGEYGQQIGEVNAGLDDIILYWPRYETDMARHTIGRKGEESSASGSFRDAVIKWEQMNGDPSVTAYAAYGLVERIEEIENFGECEDMTILIFRDSYTAPVGCFLSLLAKNVVMVDMRTAEHTAMEYVEMYDPDFIILSYSRQMMEDHNYGLGV